MSVAFRSSDGPKCELIRSDALGLPERLKQWADEADDKPLRYKGLAVLHLRSLGWTATQIAEAMTMTRRNVYYLINRSQQKIREEMDPENL